jgi:hypothetical protein
MEYFSNFLNMRRVQPIVREGFIAMLPNELIETTLHKPGRVYLADIHVCEGNSGGPLFRVAGTTEQGDAIVPSSPNNVRLPLLEKRDVPMIHRFFDFFLSGAAICRRTFFSRSNKESNSFNHCSSVRSDNRRTITLDESQSTAWPPPK